MTITTVTGPGVAPLTDADIAARARRSLVQATFERLQSDPPALMSEMVALGITALELERAMDYKTNTLHYLRKHRAPDGFQGMKVWPDADIEAWKRWHATQVNRFGAETVNPPDEVIQDILDRSERLKQGRPDYVAPWEV